MYNLTEKLEKWIKENKFEYPKYWNVWSDDEIPPPWLLDLLLRYVSGATYPIKTLIRRVNLLSKKEKNKIDKLFVTISKNCEEIDNIISLRAEKENDPWP